MTTYCTDCGKKIEHKVLEKPNFCPKCGFSFLNGGGTPPPAATPVEKNVETVDHEEVVASDINLTELDFDIEYDMSSQKHNMADVVDPNCKTAPKGSRGKKTKRLSKKQRETNKKQFLKDFQSEAGTSRT